MEGERGQGKCKENEGEREVKVKKICVSAATVCAILSTPFQLQFID